MRGSDEKKGRWRGCVCDGGGADDGENKEAESDENVELTVVNDEDGMKNVVGVVGREEGIRCWEREIGRAHV